MKGMPPGLAAGIAPRLTRSSEMIIKSGTHDVCHDFAQVCVRGIGSCCLTSAQENMTKTTRQRCKVRTHPDEVQSPFLVTSRSLSLFVPTPSFSLSHSHIHTRHMRLAQNLSSGTNIVLQSRLSAKCLRTDFSSGRLAK